MKSRFERYYSDSYEISGPGFCIIGIARSGSIYFGQLLNGHTELRCYGEIFATDVENTFSPVRIKDFINKAETLTQNALDDFIQYFNLVSDEDWGFRIFLNQNDKVLYSLLKNRTVKKIVLKRNLIDSYISLEIAKRTNQWLLMTEKSRVKDVGKIVIELDDFAHYVEQHSNFYRDVLNDLYKQNSKFLVVDYAELVSGRSNGKIEEFLNLSTKLNPKLVKNMKQNTLPASVRVINFNEVLDLYRDIYSG